MKSQFLLDPSITYLNHGSFGACPKPVFEDYQKWQRKLEAGPVRFILKDSQQYLLQSKQALAKFINCDPADFFYTVNPTFAINTVMRSLELKPGDEILSTDQEYGAMDRTWNFYCKKSGAKYIRQPITLPLTTKEKLLEDFWKGYSAKTKVVFINQISSATALIFPVREICEKAKSLGLITIVDGAHVPGHIDLDLETIQADFYTGTLHKWMLTPKGCSFLYVKKGFQEKLDPLVVSWGYESATPGLSHFLDYHEQQGTRDISAFLTAPAAIQYLQENNWKQKAADCSKLIRENYSRFCDLLQTKPICPVSEEFLGQMCSIPIRTQNPVELKELLYSKYNIEIPVMPHDNAIYLRISAHWYITQVDLDVLYAALEEILATTDLLTC